MTLNILSRDHPRMCGDHFDVEESECIEEGSPPHVRGPRHHRPQELAFQGITPACAGTT